jgi:hypothetical protein
MSSTELIFEMLKRDLSAPRVLLEQVTHYISDQYGYPPQELPRFFQEKFPTLEDYEVDLTFSPQYTPLDYSRLEYIPLLGAGHLSVSELALLKRQLADAHLQTAFKALEYGGDIPAPVHEVCIDRYVNLLRLDHKLPPALYQAILDTVPEESHNEVNLLAREEIWQNDARQAILLAFLKAFRHRRAFSTVKVSFLTNFVRTYRPAHLLEVARQLESLIESCKTDMENVQGRGFHDEYLKAMNVGNKLTATSERDVWEHYHHMMDLAAQLQEDFQALPQAAPDLLEQARLQQPV